LGGFAVCVLQTSITYSNQLHDAFPAELIKLSPPELVKLELRGSPKLTRFVLSPFIACPKLSHLDLSSCNSLNHVLLQVRIKMRQEDLHTTSF
jgi:hypothetical protein